MRDNIKFRAWDGKKMHNRVLPIMNDAFCLFDGVGHKVLTNDLMQGILMQYTGLKDKNGMEIYEGDICKVHIFVQELGENFGVIEGEREFIAEVEFGITGITVKNKNFSDNPVFYDQFHEESLEVVGNIYENPELLK